MTLTLPVPPSVNARRTHRYAAHVQKNRYRRAAWAAALAQAVPPVRAPERVAIRAHLYVRSRMDEDNLAGALKWVLDTLKQRQAGALAWRQRAFDRRGYFLDDDPAHCRLVGVQQSIDRRRPRCEITIEPYTEG